MFALRNSVPVAVAANEIRLERAERIDEADEYDWLSERLLGREFGW